MPLNKETKPKVLEYFDNMRHSSDAFTAIVNFPALWDAELAWYSPNTTC